MPCLSVVVVLNIKVEIVLNQGDTLQVTVVFYFISSLVLELKLDNILTEIEIASIINEWHHAPTGPKLLVTIYYLSII